MILNLLSTPPSTPQPFELASGGGGPDWITVGVSLISALIGAGAAIWAQRQEAKRASNAGYGVRLDAAIIAYIRVTKEWHRGAKAIPVPTSGSVAVEFAGPDPFDLSYVTAEVEMMWMVSRGEDVEVMKALSRSLVRLDGLPNSEVKIAEIRVTGAILRAWRNGSYDRDKALERLRGLAVRNVVLNESR